MEEHEYEHQRTPEGYLVAQCVKCGYWLWETFHGIPPCLSAEQLDARVEVAGPVARRYEGEE